MYLMDSFCFDFRVIGLDLGSGVLVKLFVRSKDGVPERKPSGVISYVLRMVVLMIVLTCGQRQ